MHMQTDEDKPLKVVASSAGEAVGIPELKNEDKNKMKLRVTW